MIIFLLWTIVLAGVLGACSRNEGPQMRTVFALIALAALVAVLTTPYIAR